MAGFAIKQFLSELYEYRLDRFIANAGHRVIPIGHWLSKRWGWLGLKLMLLSLRALVALDHVFSRYAMWTVKRYLKKGGTYEEVQELMAKDKFCPYFCHEVFRQIHYPTDNAKKVIAKFAKEATKG